MLADTSFIEGGAQAQTAFVGAWLERMRALPGVQAASVGSVLPPDDDPVQVELFYENNRGGATFPDAVRSRHGCPSPSDAARYRHAHSGMR